MAIVKDSVFLALKYVVCLYCEAWICRGSYMGSVSVVM